MDPGNPGSLGHTEGFLGISYNQHQTATGFSKGKLIPWLPKTSGAFGRFFLVPKTEKKGGVVSQNVGPM